MKPETKMLLAIIAYTAALFLGYGGVALAWYRGASYSISLADRLDSDGINELYISV